MSVLFKFNQMKQTTKNSFLFKMKKNIEFSIKAKPILKIYLYNELNKANEEHKLFCVLSSVVIMQWLSMGIARLDLLPKKIKFKAFLNQFCLNFSFKIRFFQV